MGDLQFANKGTSLLTTAVGIGDASIEVDDASSYPPITGTQYYYLVLEALDLTHFEVVKVTAVAGNVLTVDRGIGGTLAQAFDAGDRAENRVTKTTLDDFLPAENWQDFLAGYADNSTHVDYAGDLDDIVVNSVYNINSGVVTNAPVDMSDRGFIVSYINTDNPANITQVIYGLRDLDSYKMWMRHKSGGVWGAWKLTVGDLHNALAGRADAEAHPSTAISFEDSVVGSGEDNLQDLIDNFLDPQIGLRETAASGVLEGGGLTMASSTTIDIASGAGEIVDGYTDRRAPTRINISWAQSLGFTISMPSIVGVAYIYVDNTGTIFQQAGQLTPSQRRTNIQLGFVGYENGAISAAYDAPILSNEVGNSLYDWMEFVPTADRAKGMGINSVTGALSIWGDSGELLSHGANVSVSLTNPNIKQFPAIGDVSTPEPFTVIFSDGTAYLAAQTVMPDVIEVSPGVTDALTGNNAAIHYVYRTFGNELILQLGQTEYNSAQIARDSLEVDRVSYNYFTGNKHVLLSAQSYHSGLASDYSNPNQAGLVSLIGSGAGASGGVAVSNYLDLTDVISTTYIGQKTKVPVVDDAESGLEFMSRMDWKNLWIAGTYEVAQVVRDGSWTMVANKQTEDRPAPQTSGDPFNIYAGTLVDGATLASQVIFGNRYTITDGGYLTGIRINTVAGNHYTVFSIKDPLGTPIVSQLMDFLSDNTGWVMATIDPIVVGSVTFDLVAIVSEPDPTPTIFSGNWDYTTPNNTGVPGAGVVIHASKEPESLQVSYTDDDAGDRSVALKALVVGDVIESGNLRWAIQSNTDAGAYATFGISPAVVDTPDGVRNFNFETVTPTPITTGADIGYWASNYVGQVQGLLGVDVAYADIVPNDNAYGTDIVVQRATMSPDWDILAVYGGSASGGSGGAGGLTWSFPITDFTADTSNAYVFPAGTITQVTLPADAAVGDQIILADLGDTWDGTINVDGNGNTIEGLADVDLQVAGGVLEIVFSETEWEIVGLVSGVYRGATPPAAPQAVGRWWDNNTGRAYIWYDDGDSKQWVEEDPPVAPASGGVIGEVKMWPTTAIPAFHLLCDGSSISRATYPSLFAVLGVEYGSLDGNTFNLPDYRGTFLRGTDNGVGVDPDAATRTDRGDGTTGDAVGTKQTHKTEEHTHTIANDSKSVGTGSSAYRLRQQQTGSVISQVAGETRPVNTNINFIIYTGVA